jgi:hypothetical protein
MRLPPTLVVAVNGDFVNKSFHTIDEIVAAIEDSYNDRESTDLTVIDPEIWLQFMKEVTDEMNFLIVILYYANKY